MSSPITAGMTGPEATAAEQSRMELQARLNGLGGLNGRKLDPETKAKKLREACEGFESIFIQKMWQEMRNAVPKTGMLTGREEKYWQDMYDQELSKSMTKAGGIGLADMMYEQLSRNLVSASRTAAGSAAGSAFMPGPAPLLAEQTVETPVTEADSIYDSEAATPSIYDGEAPAASYEGYPQSAAASPAEPLETAQTLQADAAPLVQAVAPQATESRKAVTTKSASRSEKRIHAADLGQSSALLNAQKAKREAGDKLGAHTVRPSQNRQKAAPAAQTEQEQTSFAPGSAEALRAAVEMAKTGAPASAVQPINLNTLVANLQSGQLTSPVATTENSEPVVRKTRFTTNVPPSSKSAKGSKKAKQAIRMLNTDNVGPNSKAGQGLAAYHAQQTSQAAGSTTQVPPLTASQAGQGIAPLTAPGQEAGSQPIAPLTAQNQNSDMLTSFNNIPPLTAAASGI